MHHMINLGKCHRVNRRNCSVCRRLATWWAHYQDTEVTIHHQQQPTVAYIWGDRCIEFHHCPICGCATHHSSTENYRTDDIAINAHMFTLEQQNGIHIHCCPTNKPSYVWGLVSVPENQGRRISVPGGSIAASMLQTP